MEQEFDLGVEAVHRGPTLEEIARISAGELAKLTRETDWQRLMPRRGFEVYPRRSQSTNDSVS